MGKYAIQNATLLQVGLLRFYDYFLPGVVAISSRSPKLNSKKQITKAKQIKISKFLKCMPGLQDMQNLPR